MRYFGTISDPKDLVTKQYVDSSVETLQLSIGGLENDISNVGQNIALPYDATHTYAVGDYCTKDDILYKCITAITTAEAWNYQHWTTVQLASDVKEALNHTVAPIPRGVCSTQASTQIKSVSIPDLTISEGAIFFVKFEYNNANGIAPKLNVNNTGAKDMIYASSMQESIPITWSLNRWLAGETILFYYDGTYYTAIGTTYGMWTELNNDVSHMRDSIASKYRSTITYNVGDYVMYNSYLYKCTTAITTPEDFDSNHWTKTTIMAEMNN
mgnify:CR=1 FL=1